LNAVMNSNAFSLVKIAEDISVELGFNIVRLGSRPGRYRNCIVVAMPDYATLNLSKVNNQICENSILYITTEGPLVKYIVPTMDAIYRDWPVIAHSQYVCEKLVDSGFRCDGYDYPVPRRVIKENARPKINGGSIVGYLAGYMLRKYPSWAWEMESDILLYTSPNNPFLRKWRAYSTSVYNSTDYEVMGFYSFIDVYASLSTSEGVGMTPYEAALFGAVPIIADIPAFEPLRDAALFVEADGPKWFERHAYEVIEHYYWKPRDMDYMIDYVLEIESTERFEIISDVYKAIEGMGEKYSNIRRYLV